MINNFDGIFKEKTNKNSPKCVICNKKFIPLYPETDTCSEECFKKQLGKIFSSFFVEN